MYIPALLGAVTSQMPLVIPKPESSQQSNNAPVLRSGSAHTAAKTEWELPVAGFESAAFMPAQPSAAIPYAFDMVTPSFIPFPGYPPLPLAESVTVHIAPGTEADFTLYEKLLIEVKHGAAGTVASSLKRPECQQVLMQMQSGGPMSPLMIASRDNNIEMVLTLTNTGCVDARAVDNQLLLADRNGKTTLHYAEEKGHTRVVALLRTMVDYALQRQQVAGQWSSQPYQHPYMTSRQFQNFSNLYDHVTRPGTDPNAEKFKSQNPKR